MPHPDRLLVVHGCMSDAERGRLQTEIVSITSRTGVLHGAGGDAIGGFISVELRADGQDVARQLVERFGEQVAITVGLKAYPLGSTLPDGCYKERPPPADPCSIYTRQLEVDPQPGLEVTITPETSTVRVGADVKASVRLTNNGTAPLSFEGDDPETGFIVERGTKNIVGVLTGDIAGTGWNDKVEPGRPSVGQSP